MAFPPCFYRGVLTEPALEPPQILMTTHYITFFTGLQGLFQMFSPLSVRNTFRAAAFSWSKRCPCLFFWQKRFKDCLSAPLFLLS